MTSRPKPLSSALRFSPVEDEEEAEDLSSEIPETSLVRMSLMPKELLVGRASGKGYLYIQIFDLRSFLALLLLIIVLGRSFFGFVAW